MFALGRINTADLATTMVAPESRPPRPPSRLTCTVSAAAVVKLPNVKLLERVRLLEPPGSKRPARPIEVLTTAAFTALKTRVLTLLREETIRPDRMTISLPQSS